MQVNPAAQVGQIALTGRPCGGDRVALVNFFEQKSASKFGFCLPVLYSPSSEKKNHGVVGFVFFWPLHQTVPRDVDRSPEGPGWLVSASNKTRKNNQGLRRKCVALLVVRAGGKFAKECS